MTNLFHPSLVSRQPFATTLLSSAVLRKKLAHAYLLTGRAEADKWSIAKDLACYLNCAKVSEGTSPCYLVAEEPSGYCQNCRWISEEKHPQAWLVLGTDSTRSGKIAVEKARALSDELGKESLYVRVAVVQDANQDIFHRPAANALLRTIENPGVHCHFLLFATTQEEVLPTIVSRCQSVPLKANEALGSALTIKAEGGTTYDAIAAIVRQFQEQSKRKESAGLLRALDFAHLLQDQVGDEFSANEAIDAAVAVEMNRLSFRLASDTALSKYAGQLVALAELTKEQLKHYVSPKAAIESFALSWWKLGILQV